MADTTPKDDLAAPPAHSSSPDELQPTAAGAGTTSEATGPSPSTSAARRIAESQVRIPPNWVSSIVLIVGLVLLMLQGTGSSLTFILAALSFAYVFAIGYIHLREGRTLEGWAHVICAVFLPPVAILIPVLLALLNAV